MMKMWNSTNPRTGLLCRYGNRVRKILRKLMKQERERRHDLKDHRYDEGKASPTFAYSAPVRGTLAHHIWSRRLSPQEIYGASMERCTRGHVKHVLGRPCRYCAGQNFYLQGQQPPAPLHEYAEDQQKFSTAEYVSKRRAPVFPGHSERMGRLLEPENRKSAMSRFSL